MRRVSFDTKIAALMAMAKSEPGEQTALETIRRAGHRQLAREFLEDAEGWGEGGGLRLARLITIADLRRRLASLPCR